MVSHPVGSLHHPVIRLFSRVEKTLDGGQVPLKLILWRSEYSGSHGFTGLLKLQTVLKSEWTKSLKGINTAPCSLLIGSLMWGQQEWNFHRGWAGDMSSSPDVSLKSLTVQLSESKWENPLKVALKIVLCEFGILSDYDDLTGHTTERQQQLLGLFLIILTFEFFKNLCQTGNLPSLPVTSQVQFPVYEKQPEMTGKTRLRPLQNKVFNSS